MTIKTKTGRAALEPRTEPYFVELENRLYLGYRKLENGEGTWVARRQWRGISKRKQKGFGVIHDTPSKKAFDIAADEARAWFKAEENMDALGITDRIETVKQACMAYKARSDKGTKEGLTRFKRHVYDHRIAEKRLEHLSGRDMQTWIDSLVGKYDGPEEERRAKDTARRIVKPFIAALNQAEKGGHFKGNANWRNYKLPVVEDENGDTLSPAASREARLDPKQIKRLLAKCDDDLKALVLAYLYTGCRPGEIPPLTVADFDPKAGTLIIRKSKTKKREQALSTEAIAFFKEQAKGKLPAAPLLSDNGRAWTKDQREKRFKAAAEAAGLTVDGDRVENVSLYSLRHTHLSMLAESETVSALWIAKNTGTSLAMIERHYFKPQHTKTREKLDAVRIV